MAADQHSPTLRDLIGDVAPKLAELTEDVLFGDVWERPGLSKRDRSLITVATLVALNRTEQLPFHLVRALENGVTKEEIVESVTHAPCILFGVAYGDVRDHVGKGRVQRASIKWHGHCAARQDAPVVMPAATWSRQDIVELGRRQSYSLSLQGAQPKLRRLPRP